MSIRFRSRLGALIATAALAATSGLVAAAPAPAAISPTAQWITSVSGSNAAGAGVVTFGTTGVTATMSPRGGGCDTAAPNQVSNATLTSFNSQAYWSPQAPASAVGVYNCVAANTTVNERAVLFNRTIASPVLHVNNLDASTLRLRPSTIGDGAMQVLPISQNASGSVVGDNTIVPLNAAGSAGCNDTPPGPGVNNSLCGSYRLSQGDGGPIRSLRLTNIGGPASNDGWYWSMSFPMMSLTKAFGDSAVRAGEATDLTFSIANNDPDDLMDVTGLSFTDTLPAGLTAASSALTDNGHCGTPSAGALAAGSTAVALTGIVVDGGETCELTVRVAAAAPGTYANTNANISTTIANLIPNADATLRVDDPRMTLAKSSALLDDADEDGSGDVGDVLRYTFTVANTGNVAIDDVSIDDDRVDAITPADQDVPVGGTRTFTADYEITQADVDAGEVVNAATAEGVAPDGEPVSAEDDDTFVTTDRVPGLSIAKSSTLGDTNDNDVADVGETITYAFDVENTGNVTIDDVTVDDPRVDDVTPGPVDLAPAATQPFTATYVVTAADILTGVVHNEATATGRSPLGPYESIPDEDDTDTADVSPGLTIAKDADLTTDADEDEQGDVGDVVTYRFRVTNSGNTALAGVTIDDPMLGDGAITPDEPVDLAVGASADFTATRTVTQADIDRGTLRNVATASGTFVDPDADPEDDPRTITSPPDDATTDLQPRAPQLVIEKSAEHADDNDNGLADVGEEITYSFIVRNTGNTTLEDVTVLDPMVEGLDPESATLAPGASRTFTADPYTVTQADVDAGGVTNVASARGNVPSGPETTSDPDEVTIDGPDADPSLEVDKDARLADENGNGRADAGELIVYSFTVTNTGNVTMRDVRVSDPMLDGLLPDPIAVLAPGQTVVVEARPYEVTDADADGGDLVNVASVDGASPAGGRVESADASASTPTAEAPAGGGQSGGQDGSGAGVLPDAGSPLWWGALLAALTAVVAGGMLVVRPTRR